MAFVSKDCVLTIDDFCPKGGSREVTEIHGKAERVIRAIGNKQGRARMNASAELKATYFPRGMVLCSGEDIPKGTSLRARMWNLPLKPGDIPKSVTAELQKTAQDGILAQAMAGYVQWLAPQLDHLKDSLPKRFLELRTELSTVDAHGRTPEIEAKLLIGLETGLRFAVECGAIGDAERADCLSRARRAFGSLVEHQAELQTSEDPVTQFFPLLRSAISSGRAHLAASKTAQNAPENPGRCGWRVQGEVLTAASDTAEMTWEPRGNRIGWATPDEVWLDPHAAYAAVCSLARDQGESVPMTQQVLWRRLRERKLILATEQGKNTLKRTICGNDTRVLVVRAEIFWDSSSSPKVGETGETREVINSSDDLVPHSAPPLAEEQGTETGEKTLSVRSDSPGSPNSPVLRTQGNSFSALPLDFNDPILCGISVPEHARPNRPGYERKTQ
jgi:hypothetical protein